MTLHKAKRLGKKPNPCGWTQGTCVTRDYGPKKAFIIHGIRFDENDKPIFDFEEVNPSTICENTRIPDKHGNDIFTHDLVRWWSYIYEVRFDGDRYSLFDEKQNHLDALSCVQSSGLEIVGNSYDNPNWTSDGIGDAV